MAGCPLPGCPLLPWLWGHPKSHSLLLCHRRLELLLQIANKIQNGALSCEEKLTLAKNTLQAVSGGGGDFPPPNFLGFLVVCFSASSSMCISSLLFYGVVGSLDSFPFSSDVQPILEGL